MARPTKDQLEFAKAMTIKQRHVLRALAIYPDGWFMSASERAHEVGSKAPSALSPDLFEREQSIPNDK